MQQSKEYHLFSCISSSSDKCPPPHFWNQIVAKMTKITANEYNKVAY